jgi:hypothetical protein
LEDVDIIQLIQEVLNKLKQSNAGTVNQGSSNQQSQLNQSNQVPSSQVLNVNLPSGVKPIIPISGSVSNTTLKNILPDNSLSDDYLIQIKNLRITRIINSPNVDKITVAIVFAVRENNHQCLYNGTPDNFITNERPCISVISNRIKNNELAIEITKNTVFRVIKNNKINFDKKINLNDLKINDVINVNGYMDPKSYGIKASNLKKVLVSSTNQNIPPSPPKIDNTVKVEVISPNGDEDWYFDDQYEIKWIAPQDKTVSIYLKQYIDCLYKEPKCLGLISEPKYPIAEYVDNTGSYFWKVGELKNKALINSGQYLVMVVGDQSSKSDQSDKPLNIKIRKGFSLRKEIVGYLMKIDTVESLFNNYFLVGDDGKFYPIKTSSSNIRSFLDSYLGKKVEISGNIEYQNNGEGFWVIIVDTIKQLEGFRSGLEIPIKTQPIIQLEVEADDYGFYPQNLRVPKNSFVVLTLKVRSQNVYYNGLIFDSDKFKTNMIGLGQHTTVHFLADKDLTISSYQPLKNIKKAELNIIVY